MITIGKRKVGSGEPTYIIAEASSNHGRSLARAKKMIDVAAAAGADAVKFQLFLAEKMAADTEDPRTISRADEPAAIVSKDTKLIDLYRENELPRAWIPKLVAYAQKKNITFLATPFDEEAVAVLEAANMPAYKIASYEMLDVPLLRRVAKTKKPIIMSTGMATMGEIEQALEVLYKAGNRKIILLHCHSGCPVQFADVHLNAMKTIEQSFGHPVGYSDHTVGITIPIAATAMGACAVEKHFMLDDGVKTVDESFSVTPQELKDMVSAIREVERALGSTKKKPTRRELQESVRGKRSLWIVKDIEKGERLTEEHVKSLRPGLGLSPLHYDFVLGKHARRAIKAAKPLEWSDLLN